MHSLKIALKDKLNYEAHITVRRNLGALNLGSFLKMSHHFGSNCLLGFAHSTWISINLVFIVVVYHKYSSKTPKPSDSFIHKGLDTATVKLPTISTDHQVAPAADRKRRWRPPQIWRV